MPFGEVSEEKPVDENLTPPKPASSVRGGDHQRTRVTDSPLDRSVIQVVNKTIGTVHLYIQGKEFFRWKDPATVCGRWKCGSPEAPIKGAEFSSAFDSWSDKNCVYGFCTACYGDCYPRDRCQESPAKAKGGGINEDSSSSSESDS